jgi:hypothetical protein
MSPTNLPPKLGLPETPPAIIEKVEMPLDQYRQAQEQADQAKRAMEQGTANAGQPTTSQPK